MEWRVMVGEKEEVVHNIEVIRGWLNEQRIQSTTHVFNPGEGKWMCLRDVKEFADLFMPNQTLIDRYREDYSRALLSIDHEVAELVQQGKEMRALLLLEENISSILKIHESLEAFYRIIIHGEEALNRFGSERLKQLGHKPIRTRALIDGDPDNLYNRGEVAKNLRGAGYNRDHWFIKTILLMEIDYMLDVLQILVEPEFVPLEIHSTDNGEGQARYIPQVVKISVWRRDEGRCVQCKSREKLEYDHIIPVAKGGSNTERNIQLLCEPCNRAKAANIQ